MMNHRGWSLLIVVACGVVAALFLVRMAAPEGALAQSLLTERRLLAAGGFVKLLGLLLATAFAAPNIGKFDRGTSSRRGWLWLTVGMALFLAGQSSLVIYQLVLRIETPYPSIADVFFTLGYPAFGIALVLFVRAYSESGLPMGGTRVPAIASATAAVLLGAALLPPIARVPAPAMERLLNLLYPSLDLLLLIPVVVLISLTIRLHGGAIWRVWLAILAGFVFSCAGDILFAFFASGEIHALDPLVHAMFIIAYGSFAIGMTWQYQVVSQRAA